MNGYYADGRKVYDASGAWKGTCANKVNAARVARMLNQAAKLDVVAQLTLLNGLDALTLRWRIVQGENEPEGRQG